MQHALSYAGRSSTLRYERPASIAETHEVVLQSQNVLQCSEERVLFESARRLFAPGILTTMEKDVCEKVPGILYILTNTTHNTRREAQCKSMDAELSSPIEIES